MITNYMIDRFINMVGYSPYTNKLAKFFYPNKITRTLRMYPYL